MGWDLEGMESCFSNTLLTAVVLECRDGLNSLEESVLSTDWGWGHSFLTEQVWRWSLHLQQIPGCKSRNCLGLCKLKCTRHRPKDYRGSRVYSSLLLIVQSSSLL